MVSIVLPVDHGDDITIVQMFAAVIIVFYNLFSLHVTFKSELIIHCVRCKILKV